MCNGTFIVNCELLFFDAFMDVFFCEYGKKKWIKNRKKIEKIEETCEKLKK